MVLTDITARTFPALLGYGAALATAMGAFEYTGGSLWGYKKNTDIDEYERRKQLRTNYQTPAEQTFAELGEGRGMSLLRISIQSLYTSVCHNCDMC